MKIRYYKYLTNVTNVPVTYDIFKETKIIEQKILIKINAGKINI